MHAHYTQHGLTGEHSNTFIHFVFTPQGKMLEAPHVWSTRSDPEWIAKWEYQITQAVAFDDPWGLLTMRPDGDIMIFDTTQAGIRQCAEWGTVVAFLYPQRGWDNYA